MTSMNTFKNQPNKHVPGVAKYAAAAGVFLAMGGTHT